jgi:hypothetical protein
VEGPKMRPCMCYVCVDCTVAASRGQYEVLGEASSVVAAASLPVQSITQALLPATPMRSPNSAGATHKLQRWTGNHMPITR